MNTIDLIKFLQLLGLPVTEESSSLVLLCTGILTLAAIALLCFMQIMIYLISIYILNHKFILDKISNYNLLIKYLNYSKHTRVLYIVLESGMLIFCLGSIIKLCLTIIIYIP